MQMPPTSTRQPVKYRNHCPQPILSNSSTAIEIPVSLMIPSATKNRPRMARDTRTTNRRGLMWIPCRAFTALRDVTRRAAGRTRSVTCVLSSGSTPILLQDVLERARRTPSDLRSDLRSRREFRAHPVLALDVEHEGQAANAIAGVDAHVGSERDGDVRRLVDL